MTLREFHAFDARYLTDRACEIWSDSDECIYTFIKDCDATDYKRISDILESLGGDE